MLINFNSLHLCCCRCATSQNRTKKQASGVDSCSVILLTKLPMLTAGSDKLVTFFYVHKANNNFQSICITFISSSRTNKDTTDLKYSMQVDHNQVRRYLKCLQHLLLLLFISAFFTVTHSLQTKPANCFFQYIYMWQFYF